MATVGRPRKVLNNDVVVGLHLDGVSVSRIARTLGVHNERIHEILDQEGVEKRRNLWGENHPRWKGGRFVNSKSNYVIVTLDRDDPWRAVAGRAGILYEHRYVMMQHLGRPLLPTETIHHIDGNRGNNRIENLQLRRGDHGEGAVFICNNCGSYDVRPAELD